MKGDSRFEYIKQPHIMVLIAIVVLVIGLAVFTGVRRVQNNHRVANLETYDACREFIDDEPLCHFAAANETSAIENYVINSTTTNGSTTEISTLEVESADRLKSVTLIGPKQTEAYVVIEADTYVKDLSDGVWAHYADPEYEPSEPVVSTYDFTNAASADVVEFRDRYKQVTSEPCGQLTCYKYQVINPDDEMVETYVWFDDQDYLLRRHLSISDGITVNNQFEYHDVTITAPSPVKSVSAEEIEDYLE